MTRYERFGGGGGPAPTIEWRPGEQDASPVSVVASVDAFGLETTLPVGVAPSVDAFGLATTAPVGIVPSVDAFGLAVTRAVGVTIPPLEFQTSAILATKDSWYPTVAGCVDDANKNGTDLQIDGVAISQKEAIFGFDLSGFPAGSTVTDATLTLRVKTAPAVQSSYALFAIGNADEGWSETVVKCSSHPAVSGGALEVVGVGAADAGTDVIFTQIASRVDARMGQGYVSFVLRGNDTLAVGCTFESADEGTNDAFGPRLTLTFSVP